MPVVVVGGGGVGGVVVVVVVVVVGGGGGMLLFPFKYRSAPSPALNICLRVTTRQLY